MAMRRPCLVYGIEQPLDFPDRRSHRAKMSARLAQLPDIWLHSTNEYEKGEQDGKVHAGAVGGKENAHEKTGMQHFEHRADRRGQPRNRISSVPDIVRGALETIPLALLLGINANDL